MPPLEKYRIKGDYKQHYEIEDLIAIGASSSGAPDYETYTDKSIVTNKTEFLNALQSSMGYVTLNLDSDLILNENDLPVTIGDNVQGIISYQNSSGIANNANIKFIRYSQEEDGDTVFVSKTNANSADVIDAGSKNTPFNSLRYAVQSCGSNKKICVLDGANYSSELKILRTELPDEITIYSNYYPVMPEIELSYSNSTGLFKHVFKGLRWEIKQIKAGYLPHNDNGYLKFIDCEFNSCVMDLFYSMFSNNSAGQTTSFTLGIYNSVLKYCNFYMGAAKSGSKVNYNAVMYFINNIVIFGKYIFKSAYNLSYYNRTFIYSSSFYIRSATTKEIDIYGLVHIYKTSFNVNTSYTGETFIYEFPFGSQPDFIPTIENCVFNKNWEGESYTRTLTNNNFKDSGRNKIKTYENLVSTPSISNVILTNEEIHYIGLDRVGFTESYSDTGEDFKSYIFSRSNNIIFDNISFYANKQIHGLFQTETSGHGATFKNCTFKAFKGKISKSNACRCIFMNNCINFEYDGIDSIERNIFAFNDIAVIINSWGTVLFNHNTVFANLIGLYNNSASYVNFKNNIIYGNINHSIKTNQELVIDEDEINLIENLPANIDVSSGININFNPFFKSELEQDLDLHLRTIEQGYDFDSIAKNRSNETPKQDLGVYNVTRNFIRYDYDINFEIDRPNPKKRKIKEINANVNISQTGKVFINNEQVLLEEISLIWETLEKTDMDNLISLWNKRNNRIELIEFPYSKPHNVKELYIDKRLPLNYERVDNFNSGDDIYKNVELKLINKKGSI